MHRSRHWLAVVAAMQLLLVCVPAQAHFLAIARFTFIEQPEPGEVFLKVDNLPENLRPNARVEWPQACALVSRQESAPGIPPQVEFRARCDVQSLGNALQLGTRWGQDGGLIEWHYLDGRVLSTLVAGSSTGVALDLPDWRNDSTVEVAGFFETARLYLQIGAEHVLTGWDHLAFVFCLALLASGASLLWLISAFTVGHSLSLSLAHFGIVSIPIAPVEAVIALSVVFMAREAWLRQREHSHQDPASAFSHSRHGRNLLTAAFGLIHGLGFASALGDLGIVSSHALAALFFFNAGVELGQILFVLVVLLLLALLPRLNARRSATAAALGIVGGLGLFWTIERVTGM